MYIINYVISIYKSIDIFSNMSTHYTGTLMVWVGYAQCPDAFPSNFTLHITIVPKPPEPCRAHMQFREHDFRKVDKSCMQSREDEILSTVLGPSLGLTKTRKRQQTVQSRLHTKSAWAIKVNIGQASLDLPIVSELLDTLFDVVARLDHVWALF